MGRVDGATEHVITLRVYFEDTDAGGVVYHANYLRFAERARTECLRALGFEHGPLMRSGLAFAVRRAVVDFRKPARLDDALEVRTRLADLSGASLTALQTIARAGEVLAQLEVKLALVSAGGRPARLPDAMRAALKKVMATAGAGRANRVRTSQ